MAISNEDLQAARTVAARIVTTLGEKYWPIFDVIDREWAERQQRGKRLAACLKRDGDLSDMDDASG
ncbi:hypothetical protein [Hyphomonas sp.]|uniref:hypothetical protein n=1 Tax=Hyphomonas sp. TaxID=87 RepID=UPI0030FBB463|tara:strand:- start:4196 stop:4393 length:198 start_codon:yes stop_codon:yes gene_type:complete